MPASARETALSALADLLAGISGIEVRRNEPEAARVPAGGLVIVHDGEPGDPEVYLSPAAYFYSHQAEVVVLVHLGQASARDALADDILRAIGAALAADPTLGGAVDMASPGGPSIDDAPVEGGAAVKAVRVPVLLEYVSPTPLG